MAEESSFLGVIERLKAEGELLRNSGTNSIKSLKEINLLGFDVLVDQMTELIDFFKLNTLQDEENRRELLNVLGSKKEEEEKPIETNKESFLEAIKKSGFSTFLITSSFNFLEGLFVGLKKGYARILNALFRPILLPVKGLISFFRGDFFRFLARTDPQFRLFQVRLVGALEKFSEIFKIEKIKNTLRSARTILSNIGLQLKIGFLFILEDIKSLSKGFAGLVFGSEGLKEIKSLTPKLIGAFKELFTALKGIPLFGKFFELFGKFTKSLGKFRVVFRALGRVVGRFIPFVNLIFAVIDSFKGAFQALERVKDKSIFSKIFATIIGAISGLVQGFAGQFLDLIKNILSWVFEKIGLGSVSKFLDSFSFTEIFKNFFDTIIDSFVNGFERIIDDFKNLSLGKALYNLLLTAVGMFFKFQRILLSAILLPIQMIAKGVAKFTGQDSLAGKLDRLLSLQGSFATIDKGIEILRFDNPNSVNNTSGAQMEVGMGNIADSRSQPSQVFVSGTSSPQTVNANTSSVTINDSGHIEESNILTRPLTTMAYGF
jgi:hypothetical protein